MSIFDNFPYTNFHELNADWLLQIVSEVSKAQQGFDEKVQAETERAIAAENTLSVRIDNTNKQETADVLALNNRITAETQRAQNEEEILKKQIASVNNDLQKQIDANAGEIAENSADIAKESVRAQGAENALQRNISSVQQHQTLQDENITNNTNNIASVNGNITAINTKLLQLYTEPVTGAYVGTNHAEMEFGKNKLFSTGRISSIIVDAPSVPAAGSPTIAKITMINDTGDTYPLTIGVGFSYGPSGNITIPKNGAVELTAEYLLNGWFLKSQNYYLKS